MQKYALSIFVFIFNIKPLNLNLNNNVYLTLFSRLKKFLILIHLFLKQIIAKVIIVEKPQMKKNSFKNINMNIYFILEKPFRGAIVEGDFIFRKQSL